jgi:hypothetical protein
MMFLDRAEIMRARPWNGAEQLRGEPRAPRHGAPYRRRQRDAPQSDIATGKQLLDLVLLDAADVRVARIVETEIVPQDHAARAQHAEHLGRDVALEQRVEHRGKYRRLKHDIEPAIDKMEGRRVAARQGHPRRTQAACLSDALGEQIDPGEMLRARAPLDELT